MLRKCLGLGETSKESYAHLFSPNNLRCWYNVNVFDWHAILHIGRTKMGRSQRYNSTNKPTTSKKDTDCCRLQHAPRACLIFHLNTHHPEYTSV